MKKSTAWMLLLTAVFCCSASGVYLVQQNHPPEVKMMKPSNHETFAANAIVQYQVSVSDQEDGNSAYDEINAKEVLLEVKYFPVTSAGKKLQSSSDAVKTRALEMMVRSNCFNCHLFSEKSIGPSYADIQQKYAGSQAAIDQLVKHIREGSSGIWGKVTMPSHPELTETDTRQLVKWILAAAADPGTNYYSGTSGSFRIKTTTPKTGGVYRLTAMYTDHGLKEDSTKNLRGEDRVEIRIK